MECFSFLITIVVAFLSLLQDSLAFFSYSYHVEHSPQSSWSYVQLNKPPAWGHWTAQPHKRQANMISQANCDNSPDGYYVGNLYARSGTRCYNLCREAGLARRYYCCPQGFVMNRVRAMCIAMDGARKQIQRPIFTPAVSQGDRPQTFPSSPALLSLYEREASRLIIPPGKTNIVHRARPDSGCSAGLLRAHPTDPGLYYLCSPQLNHYELRRCPRATRWNAKFRMCYDWRRFDVHLNPITHHPVGLDYQHPFANSTKTSVKGDKTRRKNHLMSPSYRLKCRNRWSSLSRQSFDPAECFEQNERERFGLKGLKKKKKIDIIPDDGEEPVKRKRLHVIRRPTKAKSGKFNASKQRFWEIRRKATTTTSTTEKSYEEEEEEEVVILTSTTTTTTQTSEAPSIFTTLTPFRPTVTTTTKRLPTEDIDSSFEIVSRPTTTPRPEFTEIWTRPPTTIWRPPPTTTWEPQPTTTPPPPPITTERLPPETPEPETTTKMIITTLPPLILKDKRPCFEVGARYKDADCQCYLECKADYRLAITCCPDGQLFNQMESKPGEAATSIDEESSEDGSIYCEPAKDVQCTSLLQ